jgi:tetratricopeptide (TPR) repeat protein
MTAAMMPNSDGAGKPFFERAHTVADTGNYEFAIQMWMEGFSRDPGNLAEFEALFRMALTRKFKGGKPAGGMFGVKLPRKGKAPVDQVINNMYLIAHDPGSRTAMLDLMKNAVAAGFKAIAEFVGPILISANSTNKMPRRSIYIEVADLYQKLEHFDKAVTVAQMALEMSPNDMDLQSKIKNLSASAVMRKGYDNAKDFKDVLKDRDETKKLLQEDSMQKSEEFRSQTVQDAKAQYEKDPLNHQTITKYAKALDAMDDESAENEAIRVLMEAHKATRVYQYKMDAGSLRMKLLNRNIRMLKAALEQDPNDPQMKAELEGQKQALVQFEVKELKERAENFPTDVRTQFEYGKALYRAKQYDDAIPILQRVQGNPRFRAEALHKLGRSFYETGLKPEAVDLLRRAIENYENAEMGDKESLEYHYWLARALEETGQAPEAIKIYSKMTQWDFSFSDVRDRLKKLRAAS